MLQVSEMFVQIFLFNRLLVPLFESSDQSLCYQRIEQAIKKQRPVKKFGHYIISQECMGWKTKYIKYDCKNIRQEFYFQCTFFSSKNKNE